MLLNSQCPSRVLHFDKDSDRHLAGAADLHRVNSSQDTAAAEALGQLQGSPGGAEGSVTVRDWVRGGLLGAGGFGQVFMALNKDNHTLFAVKQVSTFCP